MPFSLGSKGNVYLTGMNSQDQDIYGFNYQASPEYSYPIECNLQCPAKSSSGWTFSPPATPESPCVESPISSPAINEDSSWNQSFASIQNSINSGTFIPLENSYLASPQNTYQAGSTQGGTQPYVSLAAINETTSFDDIEDYDGTPRNGMYQSSPDPSPATNHRTREPSWGSRSSRRASTSSSSPPKTRTSSKYHKSPDNEPRSSNHSRSRAESNYRLRSTHSSRSTTFSATASSPSCELSKGARTSHNQVEKQYRNRLNGQFETLLEALPKDDERNGLDKRVSKAEVLVLAKRHIVQLEREKRNLEVTRQELEGDVEELKRRFVGMGGVCMP